MEKPTNEIDQTADRALKLNHALARRVQRWKRLRLGAAIVLCGAAILLTFFAAYAVFAVPLFIAAIIAYLLYLDARDEAREVKSRNWGSATPRISKLTGIHRGQVVEDSRK